LTRALSKKALQYLDAARVARLATVSEKGDSLQLVPIVFANSGSKLYFVVDRKKKSGKELKRIKNISETGKATLLVDHYSENWEELSFLELFCKAAVLRPDEALREKRTASKLLRKKYPQYSNNNYFPENVEEAVFVRLEPQRAVYWQNLRVTSV
jgi:PPOX class probable F420-dependent enzyme